MLAGLSRVRGSCSIATAGRQSGKQAGSWERQDCCRTMPAGRDREGHVRTRKTGLVPICCGHSAL